MKKGSLFFIGLISAIITITSLNFAFGRPGYYERYSFYDRHHCHDRYDETYRGDKNHLDENKSKTDSLNSNY